MPVRKLSIAMDPSVARAASRAARAAGVSLSAWVSRAAANQLALELGQAAVHDWEIEHGALSDRELRDADRVLDALLAATATPSPVVRAPTRGRRRAA